MPKNRKPRCPQEFRIGGQAAVLLKATLEKEMRLVHELQQVRRAMGDLVVSLGGEEGVAIPRMAVLHIDGAEVVAKWEERPAEDEVQEPAGEDEAEDGEPCTGC